MSRVDEKPVIRIGVVSDTHGQTAFTRAAVQMLEAFNPALVLHCGDIGSVEIVALFAAWPTHFVLGNVDYDAHKLEAAINICGQTSHGRFGDLEVGGVRIAFMHGDDESLLSATIESAKYDLVCHGHTHVAHQRHEGRTLVLNPGALYRANPHTFAVVELPSREVTSLRV